MTTFTLHGDSNDTNLVLGSAAGVITDGPSSDSASASAHASNTVAILSAVSDNAAANVSENAAALAAVAALSAKMDQLNGNTDLLDVIKARGFLRVSYNMGWGIGAMVDTTNYRTLQQTNTGFLANIAKAVAAGIFGEATTRILDPSGVVLQNGTLEFVDAPTHTARFTNPVEGKSDFDLFFPSATVGRLAAGFRFAYPFGYAAMKCQGRTADLSGSTATTLLDQIKEIIAVNGGSAVYGTAPACTALSWGKTLVGLYGPGTVENLQITILETEADRLLVDTVDGSGVVTASANCDFIALDHWYINLSSGGSTVALIDPAAGPLSMTDYLCPMLASNMVNAKLETVINVVLSTQLKAVKLLIDSSGVENRVAVNNSESCLLDGANIGSSDNLYLKLGMHANAGRKVLVHGNTNEQFALVDSMCGAGTFNLPTGTPAVIGMLCAPGT